jgi:hypothetical protein
VIDKTFRERISQALWPPGAATAPSVWAVLDLARDRRIYAALLDSRLEFWCLYSGRLPRELELAASHIVELLPGHRLLNRLLDEGWGQSWGVFLKIADPSYLRHHLRKFLKVRDEAGRWLLFRYYDPRVLRAYLPSCTPEEAKTVIGPIDSYLVEGPQGRTLLEFRFDRGRLAQHPIDLEAA